jgi:phosphoglycolate phosphatase-like HAD superfamily hydrolase
MAQSLPETVLFDLDGTLVDNFEAIHRCYDDVMSMMGLPSVTLEQIRRAVGGSVNVTVVKLAGEANAPTATRLFREHFPSVMYHGLRVYPGCKEILVNLRAQGVKVAVYTNKDDANSKKLLEYLELDGLLDGIYGTNVHPWRKPQLEFTHFVLSSMKADPARTVMVGDSPFDIATARNGKLSAIHCVTTGSHTAEELAPYAPDTVHAGLAELARDAFRLG